jgi:large subunit ribosomal protein L23
MQQTIIRPIISEKSMQEVEKNKYTFAVNSNADKKMIKKAIEAQFNVTVTGIATTTVKGKTKRFGQRRIEKVQTNWKKAMVTVKKGEKIALFDVSS